MKMFGNLERMEIFILLSIILIAASIVITIYHVKQKREATDLVIHTYKVIQTGNDVYAQLLEIENDRILIYVKKDTSAQQSYSIAKQKLQRDIVQLRDLIKIPSAIAVINEQVIPLIKERFRSDNVDSTIFRSRKFNEPFPYEADKKLMSDVQKAFQQLDLIENSALVDRQANLDRKFDFSNIFLLISFGLIGVTTIIAWISLRARQKEINYLVASLKEWNLSLERKVDERTSEILAVNDELINTNEEKDNFIGIVSHDLKSPITGIQNLVHLMNAQKKAESENEYLSLILESCQHMQNLISEILDVNRIDQGMLSCAPKQISVPQLVARLQKYYDVVAREKQIELRIKMPDGVPICFSDDALLYQTLDNLISNAIKFSRPMGRVELVVSIQTPHMLFEVKDNGPGIEPNEMPLLFRKFQKLKSRPTKGESSTGLGLFIVNKYVQKLKGRLEVESVPNQQTSFKVYIPLQKETAA